jgi:ribonuclease P protein component
VIASSTAFTRARRLTQARDFAQVFGGAERSSDRFFTVLARRNDQPTARLGMAISRRAAARAVDRSRLRRQARETFRRLELCSLDFIVMARPDAVAASKDTLRVSLERHFERLSRRAAVN